MACPMHRISHILAYRIWSYRIASHHIVSYRVSTLSIGAKAAICCDYKVSRITACWPLRSESLFPASLPLVFPSHPILLISPIPSHPTLLTLPSLNKQYVNSVPKVLSFFGFADICIGGCWPWILQFVYFHLLSVRTIIIFFFAISALPQYLVRH